MNDHLTTALPFQLTVEPTGDITVSAEAEVLALNGTVARQRRNGTIRVSLKPGYEGNALQVNDHGGILSFDAVYPKSSPRAGALVPTRAGSLRLLRDDGAVETVSRRKIEALHAQAFGLDI